MNATTAMQEAKKAWTHLRREHESGPSENDEGLLEWLNKLQPLHEKLFAALRVLRDTKYSAHTRVKSWGDVNDLQKFLKTIDFDNLLDPPTDQDFLDELPVTAEQYFERLLEAGCFINAAFPPKELESLFTEAKQCYALGKFNSVCCLCRASLEKAATDICLRTNRIPGARFNLSPEDEDFPRFPEIIKKAGASKPILERVYCLYKRLCGIVHATRTADRTDARDVLNQTVNLVTQLYQINRNVICEP